MTEHEAIEQLIPWYETGSLLAEERARVERHLPSCAACRELLDHAHAQRSMLRRKGPAFLAHVDPVLLTEFAERPGDLDLATRRWIERKLEECETCREAYALLGDVAASLAPARVPARRRSGLWEWLGATVLRPAPALAYLLLVGVLVPYVLLRESGGGAPLSTAPIFVVPAESTLRDEAGPQVTPPLVVPMPEGPDDSVILMLRTSIVEADLRGGALPLRVQLRRGSETVWSKGIAPGELDFREGPGVLPLVLRAGTLHAGEDYEVSIRAVLAGDPLDGQALFRRRLAMEKRR